MLGNRIVSLIPLFTESHRVKQKASVAISEINSYQYSVLVVVLGWKKKFRKKLKFFGFFEFFELSAIPSRPS